MGASHGHKLHYHGHSLVHRAPAHLKVLTLLGFMVLVVATPRDWFWAFGVAAGLLAVVIAASRVPLLFLLPRMVVEVPFVVFAVLMPFIATGPRIDVLGIAVSEEGLWGAWSLLVKGTLGVLASLTLAATTEPRHLLAGLERLRLPRQMVQIMGLMIRYLDVVTDEMRRMRIAREARGFESRGIRSWPALSRCLGSMFIRSFERGERIHLAMLSRGYSASPRR